MNGSTFLCNPAILVISLLSFLYSLVAVLLPLILIRYILPNSLSSPRYPGMIRLNRLNKSSTELWTGVPVRISL
ncbi:hypothetical protein ECANGB1_1728 [Enterospora canceri]|uniref:Uncharacterized protein n=1 Tax=Enterospora canceri TaxID=1081671 RepID=A0A1Y1S6B9_9MICR|nr:hypothetical protein ECANGB1_1728 [Enterospora canceri]